MNYKQAAIADYDKNFEKYWNGAFEELMMTDDDSVWLIGPTSYLFSLNGLKFGVDIQIRRDEDFEKVAPLLKEQLSHLPFILITHEHEDHMCLPLMAFLKDTDIKWYIPDDCSKNLVFSTGLKEENIIWMAPGDSFTESGVKITAFHTPHARPGKVDVAERGYCIQTETKSVLIPGDIRNYSYRGYPDFGAIDLCFSHLWAGDDSANEEKYMPYLSEFAKTGVHFGAKRYFLCHLYEIAREEDKMWHDGHAQKAMELMKRLSPDCIVEVPRLGTKYNLDVKEKR